MPVTLILGPKPNGSENLNISTQQEHHMHSRGKKSLFMNWSQDITCPQQALQTLKDIH